MVAITTARRARSPDVGAPLNHRPKSSSRPEGRIVKRSHNFGAFNIASSEMLRGAALRAVKMLVSNKHDAYRENESRVLMTMTSSLDDDPSASVRLGPQLLRPCVGTTARSASTSRR
jgi:hypothetical protein